MPDLPPIPAVPDYRPPLEKLRILHEDEDLLVLDKPSGLLHVPGKDAALFDCLHERVKKLYPTASVIHRLDKDTSGVVVMARHKKAHAFVSGQFERRETFKLYIARVWGDVAGEAGIIDLPLAPDFANKPRHRVDYEHGRPATTRWEVEGREEGATRLRLFPLTGRTHQLRVHLKALGHPILGDSFYARGEALAAAPRLQLHAAQLTFRHPATNEPQTFHAAVPF